MAFGTLTVNDLLASNNQTVAQIGESNAFAAIYAALVAHRMLLRQKYDAFVEVTTDRLRRYGGPDSMTMQPIDELGRVDAQKTVAGANIGFPLDRTGIGVQWTQDFMENHTAQELAQNFISVQDADVRQLDYAIRQAVFSPTNYTFTDRLTDNVTLPVKALLNADSTPIPVGPNGEVFNAATHTHYLGTASLATADVSGLIKTVVEHFGSGQVFLGINQAQELTVRGMTPNFTPFVDARIVQPLTSLYAQGELDIMNFNNRDIGIFDAARVQVRPWIPAGYMGAWVITPGMKPLVMRERRMGAFGLTIAAEYDLYPLRAKALVNTYGLAVFQRHMMAVLDTTHSSYNAPALTP